MDSPKRWSFLETTTLRLALSWTRWRRKAMERRTRLRLELARERRLLQELRLELAAPVMLPLSPEPPLPEPTDLVTPELLPMVERTLLTPGRPEPAEEPEEPMLPPEVEIAQRLGLPVQPT